jgi:hypothetical protein
MLTGEPLLREEYLNYNQPTELTYLPFISLEDLQGIFDNVIDTIDTENTIIQIKGVHTRVKSLQS